MKRWYMAVAGGVLTAAVVSGAAYASRFGGACERRHGLVPSIVGRMVSHDQMKAIFQADKDNLRTLHSQVRAAREQLESDLIAGKNTSGDVQALETARNNMLAERVKLAQQVMASLTPEQRTKVAEFRTKSRTLHEQQRELWKQYDGSQNTVTE
jgi:Spy/CpxP family protein refolding chaperone